MIRPKKKINSETKSKYREFQDYITCLCEPMNFLLKRSLKNEEINKNKEKIIFWIREVVCELYRLGGDLSPIMILATAVYFSTSLSKGTIATIFGISKTSFLNFLQSIEIKRTSFLNFLQSKKIKREIEGNLVVHINKIIFLSIMGTSVREISHITGYSEKIVRLYFKKSSFNFRTHKSCDISFYDVYGMIYLKRDYFSNKEIAQEFKIGSALVWKLLKNFMPDYKTYKHLYNIKTNKSVVNKLISLKKQYLLNSEIADKTNLSEVTVSIHLRKYFPDYYKYNMKRLGKKKIKELKFRYRQEELKKEFKNKITSQAVCVMCLCNPTRKLLNDYLDVQEIKENKDKIIAVIKEISIRLFKINRTRLPKYILAAAIHLCTDFTPLKVSKIMDISYSPLYRLLKLVRIRKERLNDKCKRFIYFKNIKFFGASML